MDMQVLTLIFGTFIISVPHSANSLQLMRVSSMMNGKLSMYGGKDSNIQKHPYLAILKKNGQYSCAATIIKENWVITTADCVNSDAAANLSLLVGSPDGVVGAQYRVNNITIHPQYDTALVYFNLALVRIAGSFTWCKTVKPIKLPTKRTSTVSKLKVVGYMPYTPTDVCKTALEQILEGQLKWKSAEFCASYFINLNFTGSLACAYDKGRTALCSGDWGDALVKNNVVYGLFIGTYVSRSCSADAGPGLFTNIYALTGWINHVTAANTL